MWDNAQTDECTGMNEAHQMITACKELRLKILVGCMSESSCGVSAAAQLSPLIALLIWMTLIVSNDPFTGITYDKGKLILMIILVSELVLLFFRAIYEFFVIYILPAFRYKSSPDGTVWMCFPL